MSNLFVAVPEEPFLVSISADGTAFGILRALFLLIKAKGRGLKVKG